jgi:hypothetical protein
MSRTKIYELLKEMLPDESQENIEDIAHKLWKHDQEHLNEIIADTISYLNMMYDLLVELDVPVESDCSCVYKPEFIQLKARLTKFSTDKYPVWNKEKNEYEWRD